MKLKQERFEYCCNNDELWYFQFKSPKGKIIFQSDSYNTKEECCRVINSMKQYAVIAEVIQVDELEQY